ncbi:hypothetical protein OIU91_23040 [Streptomyces sp. NBC_01456]|uniref:hypothetical protein n=1 Tax=unclassified Streptomyces TaxID=2593676 RepID=UPI002E35BCE7|nr:MULTISPECIES: hypothetical protein [unclassified Streptomyces]
MRRRDLLATGAAGLALVLTACGGGDGRGERAAGGPRPLTTSEAELLSTVRFLNYQRVRGQIRAAVPAAGRTVQLTGRVDWNTHTGYARVLVPGQRQNILVRWDVRSAWLHPTANGRLPARPPRSGWQHRPLDPRTNPIDAVLLLALSLGTDRPENAQLLRQGGASRLRSERLNGTPVTVIAGPRPPDSRDTAPPAPGTATGSDERRTRYWIDADGRLHRFAALVAGGKWATLDFPQGDAAPVPTVR